MFVSLMESIGMAHLTPFYIKLLSIYVAYRKIRDFVCLFVSIYFAVCYQNLQCIIYVTFYSIK